MWVLQAAKGERRRITLLGGMNVENTGLEVFFVTGRVNNQSKVHITERHEWLQGGTRLTDLRSFLEVAMAWR